MTQEQLTDADAARAYSEVWLAQVAILNGWTEDETQDALDDVATAYDAADDASWWGADAEVYWATMLELSEDWTGEDADSVRATFAAAANTAYTVEEATSASTYAAYVGEATMDTLTDYADAVETFGDVATDAAEAVTDWRWMAGAGAVALALAYVAL